MEETNVFYIAQQIQRLDSGLFNKGDIFYRIATAADLLTGGEPMDDNDPHQDLEAWVRRYVPNIDSWILDFRRQYADQLSRDPVWR